MSPQCPTALCPGQLPSQLCATFGGGLRTPQVRLGLCWVLVFHTWCHLCPRCQELLGLCICPSLGQEQEPGCSNAAQGSLLSAKGTTQSSTEAQLPRHQDSAYLQKPKPQSLAVCSEHRSGHEQHALCQAPVLCPVLPRGCHNRSTEPCAQLWGLSAHLNPLPSSVFFLLHPSFIHPFGLEGSVPHSSAGGPWPRWGAQLLGTPHSS